MTLLNKPKRIKEIISFLNSLAINSNRFNSLLINQAIEKLEIFDEALTHSSANKKLNHEKLEFFGDAVLRLSASQFIDENFHNLEVGKRSALRAQIVSDEWLSRLGRKINIEKIIVLGSKVMGDENSQETIIAETTEALIGALYKCFNSTKEINLWLDKYWEQDSYLILKFPHKFNAKSTLQEWCQENKINLPIYKIKEVSQIHGDPKRFLCQLFIKDQIEATGYGQSHKKAEKNAASIAVEKILKSKNKHL